MSSISVVIPAYNAEKTIEPCLESVFAQTRPPDEIIVVDDGSSDRTAEVVSKFHEKVHLIIQKNQGSAKARQTGSEHATSTYIAYLDSDDWWLKDHLETIAELAEANQADFIFTDLQRAEPGADEKDFLPSNSSFYPWIQAFLSNYGRKVSDQKAAYALDNEHALKLFLRGFPAYPSTMLVSKQAVSVAGGWDSRFRRCQDFDFSLRTTKKFGCLYVDQPRAILGLHSVNSDVNAYVLMQTKGDIKVLHTHLAENRSDMSYIRLLKESLALKYFGLATTHLKLGQKKDAISSFYRSLNYPGKRFKRSTKFSYFLIRNFMKNS